MAIAFDAAAGSVANPGSSLTFAHTCTGSDRILFVGIRTGTADTTDRVTGVTYNGVAMSRINSVAATASTRVYLYYLLAPATGANNVVVSCSASVVIVASSASYTGVGNGQPDAQASGEDATSEFTQAVTTIANNCWVVGYCGNGLGNGINAGTSTTARNGGGSTGCIADNNAAKTPAGSVTLAWSGSAGANGMCVASFSPGTQVVGPLNVKTWDGLATASTKTWDGLALASIKTWNGLT